MAWSIQFCITHIVVRITSDDLEFQPDIQHLTQLYQPNHQAHADINFSIAQQHNHHVLLCNNTNVWQSSDSRDIAPAFELCLYQQVLQHLPPELISLHASSIAYQNKAYIFAGVSGAGKSSLCTAALLNGASYMTDEFSLLHQDGQVHPFPRPLQWDSINHPAFEIEDMLASGLFRKEKFSFPTPAGDMLTSHLWLPSHVQHQPLPIGGLILPQYHARSPASALTSIRRGEALMHLPAHLHTRQTHPEMLKALNQCLPHNTNFFRLDFSNVFSAWKSFTTHLESMPNELPA